MLRNGYGTYRESDKNGYTDKKQSKTKGKPKENTQKKKPYTTKKQTKRTSNPTTDRKISIPTTKAENQKLYLPKRNHGRLALGYANSAENGGIAGISHRRAGFGADIVTNFVEMT